MVLTCLAPDGTRLQFELQMVTRIGRASDNDIQVFDSSASNYHCEIRADTGIPTVRDLDSANGISVNGEPVHEAVLRPGSILKIGETEFVLEATSQLSPSPEFSPGHEPVPDVGEGFCQNHPTVQADWRCTKCQRLFCPDCVIDGRKYGTPLVKFCPVCSAKLDDLKTERAARKQEAIASHPLDPWKYPFRGEGLILLLSGTAFLAMTAVAQRFALLLGGFIFLFTTGYLLAYSQKIITSTANADHEPPTWPDFSDFTQDILPPFFQAIGLFVLYGLPAIMARLFLPEEGLAATIVPSLLILLALLLAPMAWLGMSMHDQIIALSPHFVIPSILRIPGAYLGVTIQLIVLVGFNATATWALDKLPIPFLPWLVSSFLGLYFLMVISRMLGILYYRNRAQLGWF